MCGPVGETSTAFLNITVDTPASPEPDGFEATFTVEWGPFSTTRNIVRLEYDIQHTLIETYVYKETGIYEMGHKVTIQNSGGACDEGGFSQTALLRIGLDDCQYGITTGNPTVSPSPTMGPTGEPTLSPTLSPTVSAAGSILGEGWRISQVVTCILVGLLAFHHYL